MPPLLDSVRAGRTPWAAIREAARPEPLAQPVVLLVDEAQNLPGDPGGDGRARLLTELHGGRRGSTDARAARTPGCGGERAGGAVHPPGTCMTAS